MNIFILAYMKMLHVCVGDEMSVWCHFCHAAEAHISMGTPASCDRGLCIF